MQPIPKSPLLSAEKIDTYTYSYQLRNYRQNNEPSEFNKHSKHLLDTETS